MPLERCLQFCVAAITVLGSWMLAQGDRHSILPWLTLLCCAGTLLVTDRWGWLWLNPFWSSLASLFAVGIVAWQLRFVDRAGWFLAISSLLSYLQFILLCQKKTIRHYQYLFLLSVMQATVAAALNMDLLFGALLLVYFFLWIAGWALLAWHQARVQFASLAPSAGWQRKAPPPGHVPDPLRPAPPAGLVWRNGSQEGLGPDHAPRTFWVRLAGSGTASLALAAIIFLIVPRSGDKNWRQTLHDDISLTGISDIVDLTTGGTILENPEQVLQVRFRNPKTGKLYPVEGEPLLRGAASTLYAQGRWAAHSFQGDPTTPLSFPPPHDAPGELVQQDFELVPQANPLLFAAVPAAMSEPGPTVCVDESLLQFYRSPDLEGRRIRYSLLTWGWKDGRPPEEFSHVAVQADFAKGVRTSRLVPSKLSVEWYGRLIQFPRAGLGPGLKELSDFTEVTLGPLPLSLGPPPPDATRFWLRDQMWKAYNELPTDEVRRRVDTLRDYLQESGEFTYSLKLPPVSPEHDPVQEFLLRHKTGHCEFFASALTLMLRSQGIPARLVRGYQGGDWNPLGRFYVVRQLHAHAWVEVYLPNGNWLTVDPTPAASRTEAVAARQSIAPWLRPTLDFLHALWNGYVLGYDPERQRELVYQPLQRNTQGLARSLAATSWSQWFQPTGALGEDLSQERVSFPKMMFWLTLVALAGGSLGLLVWRRRLALARVRSEARPKLDPSPAQPDLQDGPRWAGYQRLRALFDPRLHPPDRAETPGNWAQRAAQRLAQSGAGPRLATIPRRIVDWHYRTRYGGQWLPQEVEDALQADLETLAEFLENRPEPTENLGEVSRSVSHENIS